MRMHPAVRVMLLLATVFCVSLTARIAWIAHTQLDEARTYARQGDTGRALIACERAMHAWLPWPGMRPAAAEMLVLIHAAEAEGNKRLALNGWRRLRGALLSARSLFWQPDPALLQKAHARIARLSAETDAQSMMSGAAIQAEDARLLTTRPKDISGFWGLMQFCLLILWTGATCMLIWRWPDWTQRRRWLVAGVSLSGWLIWLGSLYMAG